MSTDSRVFDGQKVFKHLYFIFKMKNLYDLLKDSGFQ